jgi:hypothetical protein
MADGLLGAGGAECHSEHMVFLCMRERNVEVGVSPMRDEVNGRTLWFVWQLDDVNLWGRKIRRW